MKKLFIFNLVALALLLSSCGQQLQTKTYTVYEGTQIFVSGLQIGVGDVRQSSTSHVDLWVSLEKESASPAIYNVGASEEILFKEYSLKVIEIRKNKRGAFVILQIHPPPA